MPQGLKEYGSGFLKGLTGVAAQARADKRDKEDQDIQNRIAMAQLAISSGDPLLIRSAVEGVNEIFGVKPPKGGQPDVISGLLTQAFESGAGEAPGPPEAQAVIGGPPTGMFRTQPERAARLRFLGLSPEAGMPPTAERGVSPGAGGVPGGAQPAAAASPRGLQVSTPEQTTQRAIAEQQALDAAFIARGRQYLSPEELTKAMELRVGKVPPTVQIGAAGSTLIIDGEPGETLPDRVGAQPNVQTMWGNLPSDAPGEPARLFEHDRATERWIDPRDGQPVTGEIQQRRAPQQVPDPTTAAINRLRLAGLTETEQKRARYRQMPSEYRTAFERATSSLPPTRRPAQQDLVGRMWAEGDIQGVQEYTRQMTIEGLQDAVQRGRVTGRREAIRNLDDLVGMLEELEQSGVDTGPVSGRMEDLARFFGTSTDPRLVAISNRMLVALQAYRLAVTGVQFGFNESQQYEGMFANYRNQLPVNLAQLRGLRRGMALNQRNFWVDQLGESGAALVDAPGVGATGAALETAPSTTPVNPFR